MADQRAATRLRVLIPGEVIDPAPPRLRVPPQPLPRSAPRPRQPPWQRDLGWVLCWVAVATAMLTLAVLAGQRYAPRDDAPPAPVVPPLDTRLDVEVDAPLDALDVEHVDQFGSD